MNARWQRGISTHGSGAGDRNVRCSRTVLTFGIIATTLCAFASAAFATNGKAINKGSQEKYTVAVIGDVPYGAAKIAAFPQFVDTVNADPKVDVVAHLGDIKSGSTLCTDEYFDAIRTQFDRFKDPLVYTPGDNEWTDCHRANNGSYKPTERLDRIRSVFFPAPGQTLGGR